MLLRLASCFHVSGEKKGGGSSKKKRGGGERGLAGACFAVPRARAAFPCFVDALCLLEMGIVEQRKHTDCICEAEKDRCCDIIIAPIE
jgi:hypothetical protein